MNVNITQKKLNLPKNPSTSIPTPLSISFLWNMGFLLGMTLVLQIATGLVLSLHYVAHTNLAFESVIRIMREVEMGWIMRYTHMNGASLFFILLYSHIARGIYFNSPKKLPLVWMSGLLILLATMGAAFMGYVLPWGQMSYWGATVITSMISAIPYMGKDLMEWIWGGTSVSQPTLNRFLSLHFLIPLLTVVLALIHLMALHNPGSSNPTGTNPNKDKMKFFPYFMVKDTLPLLVIALTMGHIVMMAPNALGDVENFNTASTSTTPVHILPEWYFLFAYAILRSIPSKLGGVVAMLCSILILGVMTMKKEKMNKKFSPSSKTLFWSLVALVSLLTWIGANPVEPPFVSLGQVFTTAYFMVCFGV